MEHDRHEPQPGDTIWVRALVLVNPGGPPTSWWSLVGSRRVRLGRSYVEFCSSAGNFPMFAIPCLLTERTHVHGLWYMEVVLPDGRAARLWDDRPDGFWWPIDGAPADGDRPPQNNAFFRLAHGGQVSSTIGELCAMKAEARR